MKKFGQYKQEDCKHSWKFVKFELGVDLIDRKQSDKAFVYFICRKCESWDTKFYDELRKKSK